MSRFGQLPKSYVEAAGYLSKGRNPEYRKVANNTTVERRGNSIAVRYHATDIVTYHPDGTATIDGNGWRSATTKARWSSMGFYVHRVLRALLPGRLRVPEHPGGAAQVPGRGPQQPRGAAHGRASQGPPGRVRPENELGLGGAMNTTACGCAHSETETKRCAMHEAAREMYEMLLKVRGAVLIAGNHYKAWGGVLGPLDELLKKAKPEV